MKALKPATIDELCEEDIFGAPLGAVEPSTQIQQVNNQPDFLSSDDVTILEEVLGDAEGKQVDKN